jgi:hypothetical protein
LEAGKEAVPKNYISDWIKLDFSNTSNLKTDIQNRISANIDRDFINALNDIRGDNKNNYGISFSEITLLALAYFYGEILTDKVKNHFYTVEMAKGFLDGDNLTPYTAIHEFDVEFRKLKKVKYYNHCWLIIQSAWFFNSEYFGNHQHIDYVNHYIKTGNKLPIEKYKFDIQYLEKKYADIDNIKEKNIQINGFTLVNHWYHNILFLICKELGLSTKHFIVTTKDNREYNPLTKTSRQLRLLMPFKIIECDIKSAFPTFLDVEAGSDLKDNIYNNLMKSYTISRTEAKILFNKVCNSGKYKSQQETIKFFLDCGYSQKQCEHLISLTHNPKIKFISSMTEYEELAIRVFVEKNNLQRGARLHDALLFIDNKVKPSIFEVEPNCEFGYKELNKPVIKHSFSLSNNRLPYAHINSHPKGLNLISKYENKKGEIKGEAFGFRFYNSKYKYLTAGFNMNDYKADFNTFFENCERMFSTLIYLNRKQISHFQLLTILKHMRENSNFVFNFRAMYSKFIKYQCNLTLLILKQRDFDLIESQDFRKKIDFLNALNKARGQVTFNENIYDLFCLLEERIHNNDYEFLEEVIVKGRKNKNILSFAIIKMFNELCVGRTRKKRKGVNCYALYIVPIKSVTIKSMSLKKQQQNAYLKKAVAKYERELLNYNKLINNRTIIHQLLLILCDMLGETTRVEVLKDYNLQKKIKTELLNIIDKKQNEDYTLGAKEFDMRFPSKKINTIPLNNDEENAFETDLGNSIFNQVSLEEANNMGEIFFKEYLEFHGENNVEEKVVLLNKTSEKLILPEFDFDA